jgi:hypothetical protein
MRNSNHPDNLNSTLPQYHRWRPARLFLSPSTLHRQSRWKGFQREHTEGHKLPLPPQGRAAHHLPHASQRGRLQAMESVAPDGPTLGRPCPPVGTLKSCR